MLTENHQYFIAGTRTKLQSEAYPPPDPLPHLKNIPLGERQSIRRQIPNPHVDHIQCSIIYVFRGKELTSYHDRIAKTTLMHYRPTCYINSSLPDFILHQSDKVNVGQVGIARVEVDVDVPSLHARGLVMG